MGPASLLWVPRLVGTLGWAIGNTRFHVPSSQNIPEYDPCLRRTPHLSGQRRWAHGRVCTTLQSTVSSAYGSIDHWHTLGSQADHIHGWEA